MISARGLAFSHLARPMITSFVATGDLACRTFRSPAVRRHERKQKSSGSHGGKPTIAIARAMPCSWEELDNASLLTIAAVGNHEARIEVVKRNIMSVDNVPYDEACKTFEKIAAKNREGMLLASMPYQIGVGLGVTAAFSSFFLVFDFNTAQWFNEHFVTTDVPEPKDLETAFEVGAWTWNWMEPPLGQISFFLLCLQYSR